MDIDLETRLCELQLPVLALDMADDWFVPSGSLSWLLGKLDGCDVTRQTIELEDDDRKADHYVWMKQPEGTAGAIAEWSNAVKT